MMKRRKINSAFYKILALLLIFNFTSSPILGSIQHSQCDTSCPMHDISALNEFHTKSKIHFYSFKSTDSQKVEHNCRKNTERKTTSCKKDNNSDKKSFAITDNNENIFKITLKSEILNKSAINIFTLYQNNISEIHFPKNTSEGLKTIVLII